MDDESGAVSAQSGVRVLDLPPVPHRILEYDPTVFAFAAMVREMLGETELGRLHDGRRYDRFTRETDQSTAFHACFYESFPRLEPLYRRFVAEWVFPLFGEDVCFQRIPTFRVHLPGNVAVGEMHRDRDYAHQDGLTNFWLPLTDAWGTNALWVESGPDAVCEPIVTRYGEVVLFDAVNRRHGNMVNDTGSTRVSFDFRVMPRRSFRETDAVTINTGVPMRIGGYYDLHAGPA